MDKKDLEKRFQEILAPLQEWHEGEDFLRAVQSATTACYKVRYEYAEQGNNHLDVYATREWKKHLWGEIQPLAHWVTIGKEEHKPFRIKWTGEKEQYDAVYKISSNQEKFLEVTHAATPKDGHDEAVKLEVLDKRGYVDEGRTPPEYEGTKHNRKLGKNNPSPDIIMHRMHDEDKERIRTAIHKKMQNKYSSDTSLLVVYNSKFIAPYDRPGIDAERTIHEYESKQGKLRTSKFKSYGAVYGVSWEDGMGEDFCDAMPDNALDKFASISFVQSELRNDKPTPEVWDKFPHIEIAKVERKELKEIPARIGVAKLPCWLMYFLPLATAAKRSQSPPIIFRPRD